MKIIWTRHASERQLEWERKLGITRQEIEDTVMNPGQIALGDAGTFVAQVRRGTGLLRIAFTQIGEERRILTIYWTSKVDKYWKGE